MPNTITYKSPTLPPPPEVKGKDLQVSSPFTAKSSVTGQGLFIRLKYGLGTDPGTDVIWRFEQGSTLFAPHSSANSLNALYSNVKYVDLEVIVK